MQVGKTLVSFYDGACSIVGMNEQQETTAAKLVLDKADFWAYVYCNNFEDKDAATAAILIRALELTTPDLSPQRRAYLFLQEEE